MQKTTTSNMLKGFLFKMVPMVLILNIFFLVTSAQQQKGEAVVTQGKLNRVSTQISEPTDVPAINQAYQNSIPKKGTAVQAPVRRLGTATSSSSHGFTNANGVGARTSNQPTSNFVEDVCTFSGGLVTGDGVLATGRPFRSGIASTCATPTTCGTPNATTGALFDTIRMQNLTCASQCVSVNYIANAGGGDVFVSAYLGSFNQTALCTNRIADGGSSSLSGGTAVTFSFNLAANATVIFLINGATGGTQCPSYTMTVTGLNCSAPPPCQAPTSSVLSQVLLPGAPITVFSQNFDGTIPPAGWPVQNLSSPLGTTGWFQNPTPFPPHGGAGYAAANFNNTGNVGTISNWMFTPTATLKNGDIFTFWTRTTNGAFPDRLQVRMSTNGASVNVGASATSFGDFTTVLHDINPTYTATGYPTAWTQFTSTLSGLPAGGISGRLAFRYFVENAGLLGTNSDFIGIDDVSYTTSGITTPTTCTGSTANLKVDITGGIGPYTVVINTVPATTPITVNNYNSGENIPVTPAVTTQYTLTSVASSACCIGTGNSGTPTIVVSPTTVLPINVTALPTTAVCLGDGVLMTVTNGVPITPLNLSQTTGLTVVTGNSVSCNAGGLHTDNSYWRVYDLAPQSIPFPTYSINSVRFGVELSNAAGTGTTQPVTVRLYTQTGAAFPGGTRTLVGTQTFNVPDMTLTTFNAVFTAPVVVASNATVVVEVFTPSGQVAGHSFFLGSNALPETGPMYINAAACGIANPVTIASVGFPNMHGIINLEGQYGGGATNPVGWTFLWSPTAGLSNPTSNPVAASPMVTTLDTVVGTAPNGCNTSATYRVVVNQPPAVTTNPIDVTTCDKTSASFSVVATGTGPLTYQWQEQVGGVGAWNNLANIPPYNNANTATLTINPAGAVLNGNRYRCIVTGICNPAFTSNSAKLTVNSLPVLPITPVGPVCGGVAGINGTQLTVGSAVPPVPGSQPFTSGTINVAIPEGDFPTRPATAATNVIAVSGIPANATITGVSARLNATHGYVNDIVAVLKSPSGAVINIDALGGYQNNAGANYVNTTFSSAGVNSISTGTAPFSNTWKMDAAGVTFTAFGFTLSGGPVGFDPTTTSTTGFVGALNPTNVNGNWTLAAYDAGAPDVGSLTKWDLIIDYTTPGTGSGATLSYVWSPAAGLYTNSTATLPYTGQDLATVYAAPTTYTTYTVTGTNTSTGCVNSNSVIVNYTPPAPNVVPNPVTMCLGDAAVRLTSSSSANTTLSFTSGTISVPILDNIPAGSVTPPIVVSGIPANAAITGMKVTVNGTHTWLGDVVMVLKAPNNNVLNLDYYLGNTGAGPTTTFVNTAFSSASSTTIGTASPFTGTFKADGVVVPTASVSGPTGPTGMLPTTGMTGFGPLMASLGAGAANGNYVLGLRDAFGGDAGTLTKWDLEITYTVGVLATPATWSPAGGLYINAGATLPYTGDQRDTVWAKPTTIGANNYDVTVNSIPTPDPVNAAPIVIPSSGNGTPYPSVISVANYATTGVSVQSVKLNGVTHTWGDDIDILLQSPTGQNVVLMSDVGGTVAVPNATYTFSDAGPAMNATAANPSGTYKPTNNGATDNWPAPGPGSITQATPTLASFGNTANVNGDWKLFVVDDVAGDQGSITGGWSINLTPTSFCTSPARRVVVTVNQPASITTQPVNATVCTDKTASFTAIATGTSPTHNWQQSTNNGNPGTWTTLANGGVYSGVTSQTLTITNPPVSMNGYVFRDSVKGAAPCGAAFSNVVRLTVNPLPTVVISAAPYTKLFPGLTTTLSSTSSPAAAIYTWKKNGAVVGGSTPTLSVNVDGMGDYTLTVQDVNGCIGSSNTVSISDSINGKVFIYPNPNGGVFQVRYHSGLNNVLPRGLNIYDAKGARIRTDQYSNTAPYSRMDVDLRPYGTGIYWIEVVDRNGDRLAVGRAVVQ
ncbi:MAG: T9SS type A sorting domain-containing protein [Chitinophagaceae bacterium]|nr:T9SS type A sorting domain-containing protein [Chitinophagaceae bacterium]